MDNSVRTFDKADQHEHIEHGFGKITPHDSGSFTAGHGRGTDKCRVNHTGQHNDRTL